MFIPLNSTNRFLIAPIRAIRSFRRHLYLVSCQEPVRKLPRLLGLLGALGAPGALKPLGLLGLLGPSRPPIQLK